jgi:hypothetical protein
MSNSTNFPRAGLIDAALAIEAENAKEAGALGYMARILTQCTLPHSKVEGTHFARSNGALELNLVALDPKVGLPFGTVPRLLMAWLTTEAVRNRERTIILGDSLSGFMSELGLVPTGGRWGSITRLRDQSDRLFGCAITAKYTGDHGGGTRNALIASSTDTWWDAKRPTQRGLWQSSVVLSREFYESATTSPIPVDKRVLAALRRSPMALDIAVWLPYRLSYLERATEIPWQLLELQFGAGYADTRQFKRRFLDQLRKVVALLPDANVEEGERGLWLKPSPKLVR